MSQITSQKRRQGPKNWAGDEGDTRQQWIRPRWSTFPDWTDTDEKERRRKRRGGGGGKNSGRTDCRQLITCGPEDTNTHAHRHTQTCTRTNKNSSFLDEATPKTEGWFMRRSRPMGIRACSGIRLNKKKKRSVSDKTESKRLETDHVEYFDSKPNEKSQTKYFHTFLVVTSLYAGKIHLTDHSNFRKY